MKELQKVENELYDVESRRTISNEDYIENRQNPNLPNKDKPTNYPDARKHMIASFIKSIIRILGYACLWYDVSIAATILILSEVVGVGEELV